MFGKWKGGGGSQGLKKKEGKGNESTLHSKCLVYKGEWKGKNNPYALVQILSSLYFLPI